MVICILARHAMHDLIDRVLVGRSAGVDLNTAGQRQATALATHLQTLAVETVQSSPRERALETAKPVADSLRVPLEVCGSLDEIEFGRWSGRTFEDLSGDPDWRQWNEHRSTARAPGGESMSEAQARIVAHMKQLHVSSPEACVLLVTHAELIRAAVLSWLSLPLDAWWRIEVPPASITRIEIFSNHRARVTGATRIT